MSYLFIFSILHTARYLALLMVFVWDSKYGAAAPRFKTLRPANSCKLNILRHYISKSLAIDYISGYYAVWRTNILLN